LNSPAVRERGIGEKLLIAVLILAVGDVTAKALGFIISIVRTRTLTTEEFGGLGFIVQTVGMFAQLAGFSLGLAATRYIGLHRHTEPRKAQEIAQFILFFGISTTVLASVLMLIFVPVLTMKFPVLAEPMRVSVLVLITQTLSGLLLGMLVGMERFRAATLAGIVQNVFMLLFTLWWAPLYGLMGTIYAMSLGFLGTLLMAWWGCRDLLMSQPFNLLQLWQHRSILWEFCLPAILSSVVLLPATWLSMAIIAAQHGPVLNFATGMSLAQGSWIGNTLAIQAACEFATGLTALAIFFAADQLRPLLGLLTNIVAQPMIPLVTAQIKQAEDHSLPIEAREAARKKAMNATLRSFQLVVCLVLPAHAMLAFAGPYVMAIFGKTFATEWNVFLVVLALGAFSGVSAMMGFSLQAQGRVWLLNVLLIFYGIFILTFTWLLRKHGAMGLSFAYVLAMFCNFCLSATLLIRSGLLSYQALCLMIGTIVWLTIVSFAAAWIPASYRLVSIPVACAATMVVLFLVMRPQMMHVIHLVRRKVLKTKQSAPVVDS
jgi:O-antigen/teichoic acid export membrane protein